MKRISALCQISLVTMVIVLLLSVGRVDAKIRWKTASLAPKDVGYSIHVRNILMPALTAACEDELVIKAYWGGIMGDDKQALKNIRIKRLQCAGLSGQGTFLSCPEMSVMGLPFLFRDYGEVGYIQSKMIDSFDQVLQKRGLKILYMLDQGFDETYSLDKPLKSLEDFKGYRFATWFGPLEGKLLQSLGANPSPIDPMEIPSSIRSGVVEGVIAPSIWIVGTQLYTVMKYVNPLKMRYSPALWVASDQEFKKLPVEYQKNIDDMRIGVAAEFNGKVHVDLQKSLEAMVQYGMTQVDSSPADIQAIRQKATPIWYELAGDLYPTNLLDEVLSHLAVYRYEGEQSTAEEEIVEEEIVVERQPEKTKPKKAEPPRGRKLLEKTERASAEPSPKPKAGAVSGPGKKPVKMNRKKPATWAEKIREIKLVQAKLKAMGYYPAKVDGILGPISYRGIKGYQQDKGLKVTGTITEELLDSLDIQ